jgi:hypothetical protein
MLAKEISKTLANVPSWTDPRNARACNAFCVAMLDRQYGFDPLLSAWNWFLRGWLDHEEQPRMETPPAPEPPEKTWDCVCGRSTYVTYTRCDHCGFQRPTANR